MFARNESHLQTSLFGVEDALEGTRLSQFRAGRQYHFYELIFCNIDEDLFRVLYSPDPRSRPNSPVNVLVGAIILQYFYGCTGRDLFERLRFGLLTRWALGIRDFAAETFCEVTYYNFQNRLAAHYGRTGEDLPGFWVTSSTDSPPRR